MSGKTKHFIVNIALAHLVQSELVGPLHVGLGEPTRAVDVVSFERGLYLSHCVQLVLELELGRLCCANFQSKQNCGVF